MINKHPFETSKSVCFLDTDDLPGYFVMIEWHDSTDWKPYCIQGNVAMYASLELAQATVMRLQNELFSKRSYRFVIYDQNQPTLPCFGACRQVFELPACNDIDMMFKSRQWEFWISL